MISRRMHVRNARGAGINEAARKIIEKDEGEKTGELLQSNNEPCLGAQDLQKSEDNQSPKNQKKKSE